VDPAELPWPETTGRVLRHPLLHVAVETRGEATQYGGLALAEQFVRRLRVAQRIDERLQLFKRHAPYHESDHVLAMAYTLYADGQCLEDQAVLQGSEAVRRMLGACRIPDPTTAGDFLRRFAVEDVEFLGGTIDEIQEAVWKTLPRPVRRHRQTELARVDLDGHIKELYGEQKEGADFSYDGRWSYHPLLISLAGTGECLRLVNRPGNVRSSDGAAAALSEVLPRVRRHFRNALVRGDTDFDRADLYQAVIGAGAYFAIGGRMNRKRAARIAEMPAAAWAPFVPKPTREKDPGAARRQGRTPNCRRARARQFRTLDTTAQWLTEIAYQPAGLAAPCRLIVRRIRIAETDGQGALFTSFRYRLVLTNLPRAYTAQTVIDLTYQRCDQENVIAELGAGISGWWMPVAEFVGNAAWLQIARLAWNLGKWIAQLALPAEVVRWEWKRFRRHFVYLAAQVVRLGRQTVVRLADSPRYLPEILAAHGGSRSDGSLARRRACPCRPSYAAGARSLVQNRPNRPRRARSPAAAAPSAGTSSMNSFHTASTAPLATGFTALPAAWRLFQDYCTAVDDESICPPLVQCGMGRGMVVDVSARQRRALTQIVKQASAPAQEVRRAQVILWSAEGSSGVEIARRLQVSVEAVSRIRRRFVTGGVEGLATRPKAGRKDHAVPAQTVERLIELAMSPPPPGRSRWTTRLLGREVNLTSGCVSDLLRAHGLRPHHERTYKVSRDPEFVAKVRDIVGLYVHPPTNAVVLSVDEQTSIQALERTQLPLPMRKGRAARHTHDYKRHGVVDLYAALEVATGDVTHRITQRHTAVEFLAFMRQVARAYPDQELHVILDNSSSHRTPAVVEWLAANPRIHFHYTPTSASWLNQVEGFFGILGKQSLSRTDLPSKKALREHLNAFMRAWRKTPTPFVWTKPAAAIIKSHRRMLERISTAVH
jgi:transposase